MAGLASPNVLLHRLRVQGQQRGDFLVELRKVIVPCVLHAAVFKNELAQRFNELLTRTNRRRWVNFDNPLYPVKVFLKDRGISDCWTVLEEMEGCRSMESRNAPPCIEGSAADAGLLVKLVPIRSQCIVETAKTSSNAASFSRSSGVARAIVPS